MRAVAADTRSQAKNRELARTRLAARLAAALRVGADPPSHPERAAAPRRLGWRGKRRRADVKRMRGRPERDD